MSVFANCTKQGQLGHTAAESNGHSTRLLSPDLASLSPRPTLTLCLCPSLPVTSMPPRRPAPPATVTVPTRPRIMPNTSSCTPGAGAGHAERLQRERVALGPILQPCVRRARVFCGVMDMHTRVLTPCTQACTADI
jgi:hypothetical protein